ncbi:tRNA (adenosine(37)-N6)-threonylcarbamoyltransferase complex dimerization subunit type 1 TsaB [Thalassotalea insulae]|uniref:tRNA threonylcarbamoyladenosine biosynthesis protein TsaB n=1 Tax=Thalassotalea insulae TaxID=2056778 RepID=A0ABQ6GQW1_9GAMM|nr:tRNA (adenosine(37)-N6)-threonylcarbamoyltransferase complex dimerization subunit type 1 TsaB [Thalassotalea insulae]GLX77075.1 tRNA (adenosine(37)-N6)-threonylcarbamoyltransferase complex dimerization subunit type 1 TsaB [Thalassotalea insulae]
MVNYLAIDASTEACSAALMFNGQLYQQFELCPQSHSLVLLPMVDKLLTQAGCQLTDLDGLVFGQGPGSFTGVRIGIGVAQGLAFAADLPVVGVSTLQAMAQVAYQQHQQTEVIAAIDARMSEVYLGYFRLDANGIMAPIVEEAVLPPEQVRHYLTERDLLADDTKPYGVGTGWDAYQEKLAGLTVNQTSPEVLYPHAEAMLTIAEADFDNGNAVSAELAQPVYVRDTVSWKKLPGRE